MSRTANSDTKNALTQNSPSVAPRGSITIPSHRRIVASGSAGRAWCSSGPTTVGPDTTSTAPRRNEARTGWSNSSCAAGRHQQPGEHGAQRHQPEHRPPGAPAEVGQPQLQAAGEQQQADRQRHHREQRVAEDRVRLDPPEDRPGDQPAGQQQHDRRDAERGPEPLQPDAEHDDEGDAPKDLAFQDALLDPAPPTGRTVPPATRSGAGRRPGGVAAHEAGEAVDRGGALADGHDVTEGPPRRPGTPAAASPGRRASVASASSSVNGTACPVATARSQPWVRNSISAMLKAIGAGTSAAPVMPTVPSKPRLRHPATRSSAAARNSPEGSSPASADQGSPSTGRPWMPAAKVLTPPTRWFTSVSTS